MLSTCAGEHITEANAMTPIYSMPSILCTYINTLDHAYGSALRVVLSNTITEHTRTMYPNDNFLAGCLVFKLSYITSRAILDSVTQSESIAKWNDENQLTHVMCFHVS